MNDTGTNGGTAMPCPAPLTRRPSKKNAAEIKWSVIFVSISTQKRRARSLALYLSKLATQMDYFFAWLRNEFCLETREEESQNLSAAVAVGRLLSDDISKVI